MLECHVKRSPDIPDQHNQTVQLCETTVDDATRPIVRFGATSNTQLRACYGRAHDPAGLAQFNNIIKLMLMKYLFLRFFSLEL